MRDTADAMPCRVYCSLIRAGTEAETKVAGQRILQRGLMLCSMRVLKTLVDTVPALSHITSKQGYLSGAGSERSVIECHLKSSELLNHCTSLIMIARAES